MIIPGDRAILRFNFPWIRSERADEFSLRTFAAIVDSPYYSRFLLFATFCIEKYLESIFATPDELTSKIGHLHRRVRSIAFVEDRNGSRAE